MYVNSMYFIFYTNITLTQVQRRVISQASDNNLKAILQYSIFPSEKQLLAELDSLEKCRTGTNIVIYNLKK